MIRTDSFRDPGGYVTVSGDCVIRTVLPEGKANLSACLNSAAAGRFVERGSLIPTYPVGGEFTSASAEREIQVEHPRIPFASYPHEWSAPMLHAAAELTLDLCDALLEEGRGLKDATPANILFRGARPVFVDVLSFEERDPLDSIWLADAQFARTFLIPLLLHLRTGAPVHEFFLSRRDGFAPPDAVNRLPGLRRWLPPDLGLVTLPAYACRLENQALYRPHRVGEPEEARFILGRRFRGLRKTLQRLKPPPRVTAWSRYETACPSYSAEQQSVKRRFVGDALREIEPSRVLDIGSNRGEFSLMAASSCGASVVAVDSDPETVAALWRSASAAAADVLPLCVDFARPTPPLGWRCGESAGFFERAEGYFDCVLLLAAVHHLLLSDRVPLAQIFDALAAVTTRWLLIEYVGPGDAMFRRLARGRDGLYSWYGRDAFERQASRRFEILRSADVPSSDRALFLLRRKP